MADKTWKKRERQVAEYFGAKGRNPLSGVNSKHGAGDIIHKDLTVEHKHRKRHSAITLWDKVKMEADAESKIPVLTLSQHNRKGFWVMVHSSNLVEVGIIRRNVDQGGF